MTKKDYELIAGAIKETYRSSTCNNYEAVLAVEEIVAKLSVAFQDDNPRFNKEKFINKACGF